MAVAVSIGAAAAFIGVVTAVTAGSFMVVASINRIGEAEFINRIGAVEFINLIGVAVPFGTTPRTWITTQDSGFSMVAILIGNLATTTFTTPAIGTTSLKTTFQLNHYPHEIMNREGFLSRTLMSPWLARSFFNTPIFFIGVSFEM